MWKIFFDDVVRRIHSLARSKYKNGWKEGRNKLEIQASYGIILCFIAASFGAAAMSYLQMSISSKQTKVANMVLTMRIDGPLIRSGGTIVLLPRATPTNESCPKNIVVKVSNEISFKMFDYCSSNDWAIKFEHEALERDFQSTQFKTLTNGSGEYDNHEGVRVTVPQYQMIHIAGSKVSEAISYYRGNHYYEYLAAETICPDFGEHAKVCVPSSVDEKNDGNNHG